MGSLRETHFEMQQRIIGPRCCSPAQVKDVQTLGTGPFADIIKKELHRRQAEKGVARAAQMKLHDAVALDKQPTTGELPFDLTAEQVQPRSQTIMQPLEIGRGIKIRGGRADPAHGFVIQVDEFVQLLAPGIMERGDASASELANSVTMVAAKMRTLDLGRLGQVKRDG